MVVYSVVLPQQVLLQVFIWMLMLVGRFVSAFISGKVSSRMQLTVTSAVALLLLLVAIFMPETCKMSLSIPNLAESTFDHVEVPTRCCSSSLRYLYLCYVGCNLQPLRQKVLVSTPLQPLVSS